MQSNRICEWESHRCGLIFLHILCECSETGKASVFRYVFPNWLPVSIISAEKGNRSCKAEPVPFPIRQKHSRFSGGFAEIQTNFLCSIYIISIIDAYNLSANFLIIDSVLVNKEEKRLLERHGRQKIQIFDISEQKQLLSLLAHRLSCTENSFSKPIIQRLTTVIVGLVVKDVAGATETQSELQGNINRYKEIAWDFRELLESNIRTNRAPSFYAERLNITVAYLNEAINAVWGTSVSRNIQDEIILQAKRQLVYTTTSVKEIAQGLGFDDYSYFTRLFTKVAGVSPTLFRKNYHE